MDGRPNRDLRGGFRLAFVLTLTTLPGCVLAASPAPTAQPAVPASAAAGIYTDDQADQGQTVFRTSCGTCHNPNQFTGQMFAITWMNEPVGALYQFIRDAMPQNDPGSLSDAEYAAIVAYVLRNNGRPAGDQPLPADGELLGQVSW